MHNRMENGKSPRGNLVFVPKLTFAVLVWSKQVTFCLFVLLLPDEAEHLHVAGGAATRENEDSKIEASEPLQETAKQDETAI